MNQFDLFQPKQFNIRMSKDVPMFDESCTLIVTLKEGQVLLATKVFDYKFVTEFGVVYIDEAQKV